ncbi:hypothetical protein [Campylobacter sp. RM5004]|uniref:hypothetical protein n=1 Tax=Campylobacter sp. RM5004 TaxID=1660078 RepID=UPI0023BAB791|nr:hypothetical protein [Campylobacter sp. RM5004]
MIKIDCDHIYDAKKLFNMFYLVKSDYDVVSIPRINFIIKDNEVYIETYNKNLVLRDVVDHWLIKNTNLNFKDFICNRFIENLKLTKNHKVLRTELNNYHFPYIKAQKYNRYGRLIKLDDFINSININEKIFNQLDLSILNRSLILNIYTKFTKDKNE